MKLITFCLITLVLFVLPTRCFSQEQIVGVYDKENREFVTESREYHISYMLDGYAEISKSGYFGMIDSTGRISIPVEYDGISRFDFEPIENAIVAYKNGKAGLIDLNGGVLIPFKYDGINGGLVNGILTPRQDGKMGAVNRSGEVIIPFEFSFVRFHGYVFTARTRYNHSWYYNLKGQRLLEFPVETVNEFEGGFAIVKHNDKYGFIDSVGNLVVTPQYDGVTNYRKGFACVRLGNKWTFIDKKGKQLVPPQFTKVEPFRKGLAVVNFDGSEKPPVVYDFGDDEIEMEEFDLFDGDVEEPKEIEGGQWGAINAKGEFIVDPTFEKVYVAWGKPELMVATKNAKKGLLNLEGESITEFEFDEVEIEQDLISLKKDDKYALAGLGGVRITDYLYDWIDPSSSSHIVVWKNEKCGVITRSGEALLPIEYDKISVYSNGSMVVNKGGKYESWSFSGGKYGLFKNQVALTKIEFDEIRRNRKGGYVVRKNGKYGLLDEQGMPSLELDYDQIYERYQERSLAKKNGKMGLLDMEGTILIPFDYDTIYYQNGWPYKAIKEGKLYLFDDDGTQLSVHGFDEVGRFYSGFCKVKLNGTWAIMDLTCRILFEAPFESIDRFSGGMFVVKKGGKYGAVNRKGELMVPLLYDGIEPFKWDGTRAALNGEWITIDKMGQRLD